MSLGKKKNQPTPAVVENKHNIESSGKSYESDWIGESSQSKALTDDFGLSNNADDPFAKFAASKK
jgi:hypothetical protein